MFIVHVAGTGQVESRKDWSTRLPSMAGSENQQSASGESAQRTVREATTIGGAGFGWGSGKGKGLASEAAHRDNALALDSNRGARISSESDLGGEGGGFRAGQLAIKAATRFKMRARKGDGRDGGGQDVAEVSSSSSHGAQSLRRGLAAEVNSRGGRSSDLLSRGPHAEVCCGGPAIPPRTPFQ